MKCLSNYDIIYLGKKAEELGFVRDTLEKVTRLADILEYLNTNPVLKDSLALKGGTAINLTIFNLPRLSVDIDMDYLITNSREEMLERREIINRTIERYMLSQGYAMNPKRRILIAWIPGSMIIWEPVGIEITSKLKSIIHYVLIYLKQKKDQSLQNIFPESIK
jgi:hypothetical protein